MSFSVQAVKAKCSVCQQQMLRLGPEVAGQVCMECARNAAPPAALDPLDAARVPARFRDGDRQSWEAFFQHTIPQKLDNWPGERPQQLLVGKTGTGKTSLATILLREQLALGRTGLWIRHQRLISVLRGGMGLNSATGQAEAEAEARRLEALCLRVDVLLIDDLFAGPKTSGGLDASPWVVGQVLAIVAERYDNQAATLVTTMHMPTTLQALDASLASRLLDGRCVVPFTGGDRRLARG